MMGAAEGRRWPGTEAETKFAEYLVRTAGAHFVTIVRRGVGELRGVRVPRQAFVVQELMEAASASTLESLQRENEALRQDLKDATETIEAQNQDHASNNIRLAETAYRAETADAKVKRLTYLLEKVAPPELSKSWLPPQDYEMIRNALSELATP